MSITLPSSPAHSAVDAPHRLGASQISPALLVTIDTEEEFDWNAPPQTQRPRVTHTGELARLQDTIEMVGARATYVIDYPLLVNEKAVADLAALHAGGSCELGTHLHPWVNPPVVEAATPQNTYLSNLPLELQVDKLAALTSAFTTAFGFSPTSFKAGRYGLDDRLVPALAELGYRVDGSPVAYTSFAADDSGPDFRAIENQPFRWKEANAVVSLPCSVAYTRGRQPTAHRIHQMLSTTWLRRLRSIGILWHTRLLRKIFLSPEIHRARDLCAAIDALGRAGAPLMHITLHSPSIAPGHTPYVRSTAERDRLLHDLATAIRHARERWGAEPRTLSDFVLRGQETSP